MKERSLVEMLMVSLVSFITFVLFYQTILTLTKSVSNSGQLNISSLVIIVVIDQLAIRVGFGLLALATLKIL
jgi:competence protein ComGC